MTSSELMHFLLIWITIAFPSWLMYRIGYRQGRADLIRDLLKVAKNLDNAPISRK